MNLRIASHDIQEFFTHEFHGIIQSAAPKVWEPALVAARMIEAARVLARTTQKPRPFGYGPSWVETVATYEDILGRGQAHRREVWETWARSRPQFDAQTIQRAEEALEWPSAFLSNDDGPARVLILWAASRGARAPFEKIIRRRGWAASTARKKKARALALISDGLTARGVPVRLALAV